jgi:hypothetical protein
MELLKVFPIQQTCVCRMTEREQPCPIHEIRLYPLGYDWPRKVPYNYKKLSGGQGEG